MDFVSKNKIFLIFSLLLLILFGPKTYFQPDSYGYIQNIEYFAGLKDKPFGLFLLRPTFQFLASIPYRIWPSKWTVLGFNIIFSVASLFLIYELMRKFKLNEQEGYYSAIALLFSPFFFLYAFTILAEPIALFTLVLTLYLWKRKENPVILGLSAGIMVLSKEISLVILGFVAFIYIINRRWKELMIFLLVSVGIIILWQLCSGVNYLYKYQLGEEYTSIQQIHFDIKDFIYRFFALLGAFTIFAIIGIIKFKDKRVLLGFGVCLLATFSMLWLWKYTSARLLTPILPWMCLYSGVGLTYSIKKLSKRFPMLPVKWLLLILCITINFIGTKDYIWIIDYIRG